MLVKEQYSEPHNQQQNTVEMAAIRWLVQATHKLLDHTGAPDTAWYLAMKYLAKIHNICYDPTLGTTPEQRRHGVTPEILSFLQHRFWDPILYYDHEAAWPETKERSGRWVGLAENIGDVLTYWIIDDQSKQLLARSVVRPFWGNKRVKWDPDFVKAPFKNTAHNGGDLMPSKETRGQLLDNVLDKYDEQEPDPKGHDPVTEWGYKRPSVPNGSSLKIKETKKDPGMNVKKPYVEYEYIDTYDGPSLLRYSSNPLPMNSSIESTKLDKKRTPRFTKYKQKYSPKETNVFVPAKEESNQDRGDMEITPEPRRFDRSNKGEAPVRLHMNHSSNMGSKYEAKNVKKLINYANSEMENVRKSINLTKWVPWNVSQLMKLAASFAIDVLLLPTHVVAQPRDDFPSIPTLNAGMNSVQQFSDRSKKITKLRAYHAVLDRWNGLMNPDPLENRWAIKKVISDREIRKDTEERTVLMKVQYNDGPTKWMTIDELQIVDPYLAINHAMTYDIMYQQEYSWVQTYLDFDEEVVEMVQAYKAAAKDSIASLYGKTREKLYINAGPEFGPELMGKRLIIDKSLY